MNETAVERIKKDIEGLLCAIENIGNGLVSRADLPNNIVVYRCGKVIRIDIKEG